MAKKDTAVICFELKKHHQKKAKPFCKEHLADCYHGETGASGGGFNYVFTPTAIGTGVEVECGKCRQRLSLTDYGKDFN